MIKIKLPIWNAKVFGKTNVVNDDLRLIKSSHIFKNLSQNEVARIYNIVHERKYKKNDFIFEEGNPGSALFILKEGNVVIEKNGAKIDILEVGDFVGEVFLLSDTERNYSARCEEESKLLVLFCDDLMEMVKNEPKIGVKIMINISEILTVKLIETNKILANKFFEYGE